MTQATNKYSANEMLYIRASLNGLKLPQKGATKRAKAFLDEQTDEKYLTDWLGGHNRAAVTNELLNRKTHITGWTASELIFLTDTTEKAK